MICMSSIFDTWSDILDIGAGPLPASPRGRSPNSCQSRPVKRGPRNFPGTSRGAARYLRLMCNGYEQHVAYGDYQKAVRAVELETPSSESEADLPQADDIKIGDLGPVLVAHGNGAKLVLMRF